MADETKTAPEKVEKIAELINDIDIAMLTTINDDGSLRSRPMRYRQSKDGFDGNIYFFTHASAHKVDEIQSDERVNVAFANPKNQDYVSITGSAKLSRDQAKIKELWNPVFNAWFPDGLEDPDLALFVVKAEGAEYWDSPTSPVAHLYGFIKTKVKGEVQHVGEDEKVAITPGAVAAAKS